LKDGKEVNAVGACHCPMNAAVGVQWQTQVDKLLPGRCKLWLNAVMQLQPWSR